MLSHWAPIVSYIREASQWQDFQNVQGRVSSVMRLISTCACGLSYALMRLQGQAFDMQVTGDEFFECRLEFFNVIVKYYRETFKRSSCPKRDQDFFLCGQMLDFRHRLLRGIVDGDTSHDKSDWAALRKKTTFFRLNSKMCRLSWRGLNFGLRLGV